MAQRKKSIEVLMTAVGKRWSITISGNDKDARERIIKVAKDLEAGGFKVVNAQPWLEEKPAPADETKES